MRGGSAAGFAGMSALKVQSWLLPTRKDCIYVGRMSREIPKGEMKENVSHCRRLWAGLLAQVISKSAVLQKAGPLWERACSRRGPLHHQGFQPWANISLARCSICSWVRSSLCVARNHRCP